jgi:O-antigen ligase
MDAGTEPLMSVGTVLATVGAAGVLGVLVVRPRLGLLALILYYPFIDLAARSQVPGLNAETLLLSAGIGVTVTRKGLRLPPFVYLAPLAAYFALMAMGWLVTLSWYQGEYPFLDHWDNLKRLKSVLFPTLVFFLTYIWLDDSDERLRGIEAISIAVGISAATGLVDWALSLSDAMSDGGRAAGVFVNPNRLGVLLASFSVVSATLVWNRTLPGWRRGLHGAMYGLALFVVVLTLSRKAWIAILLAHFVWLLFVNRAMVLGLVFGALVAMTVAYPLMPEIIQERVEETFRPGQTVYWGRGASRFEGSAGQRIALYQAGIRMFGESPIWGHGLSSFLLLSPYYGAKYGLVTHRDPHSLPLKVAAENGVIGLGVLAWVAAVVAGSGLLLFRRSRTEAWIGAVFLATVASLFLSNLLGTVMYEHNVSFLFWALFGLVARAERSSARQPSGTAQA